MLLLLSLTVFHFKQGDAGKMGCIAALILNLHVAPSPRPFMNVSANTPRGNKPMRHLCLIASLTNIFLWEAARCSHPLSAKNKYPRRTLRDVVPNSRVPPMQSLNLPRGPRNNAGNSQDGGRTAMNIVKVAQTFLCDRRAPASFPKCGTGQSSSPS